MKDPTWRQADHLPHAIPVPSLRKRKEINDNEEVENKIEHKGVRTKDNEDTMAKLFGFSTVMKAINPSGKCTEI